MRRLCTSRSEEFLSLMLFTTTKLQGTDGFDVGRDNSSEAQGERACACLSNLEQRDEDEQCRILFFGFEVCDDKRFVGGRAVWHNSP